MDLKECRYILKIATTKNISKAAAELYVSQPALSRYLNNVEEDLGIRLFDRTTYPISLTPAGEVYVANAHAIIDIYENMVLSINEIKNTKKGKLTAKKPGKVKVTAKVKKVKASVTIKIKK